VAYSHASNKNEDENSFNLPFGIYIIDADRKEGIQTNMYKGEDHKIDTQRFIVKRETMM
jgi:hypothetical protein